MSDANNVVPAVDPLNKTACADSKYCAFIDFNQVRFAVNIKDITGSGADPYGTFAIGNFFLQTPTQQDREGVKNPIKFNSTFYAPIQQPE